MLHQQLLKALKVLPEIGKKTKKAPVQADVELLNSALGLTSKLQRLLGPAHLRSSTKSSSTFLKSTFCVVEAVWRRMKHACLHHTSVQPLTRPYRALPCRDLGDLGTSTLLRTFPPPW